MAPAKILDQRKTSSVPFRKEQATSENQAVPVLTEELVLLLQNTQDVPPDDDETAPQPEKHTAKNKILDRLKSPHFDDSRILKR